MWALFPAPSRAHTPARIGSILISGLARLFAEPYFPATRGDWLVSVWRPGDGGFQTPRGEAPFRQPRPAYPCARRKAAQARVSEDALLTDRPAVLGRVSSATWKHRHYQSCSQNLSNITTLPMSVNRERPGRVDVVSTLWHRPMR